MGPDHDAVGSIYAQGAHQHGEGGRAGGGVARYGIDSAFPLLLSERTVCRKGNFRWSREIGGGSSGHSGAHSSLCVWHQRCLASTAWKTGCSRVRAGCSRYSAANSSSPISTCRASNPPSVYGNRNLIGLHADDAHPLLWTYDGSPIHGRCRGVIDSRGHSFIVLILHGPPPTSRPLHSASQIGGESFRAARA